MAAREVVTDGRISSRVIGAQKKYYSTAKTQVEAAARYLKLKLPLSLHNRHRACLIRVLDVAGCLDFSRDFSVPNKSVPAGYIRQPLCKLVL